MKVDKDFYNNIYLKYRMLCVGRHSVDIYGGARAYTKRIRRLVNADFVLMKYKKEFFFVPAEFAVSVFLKGGVFVNE